MPPEPPMPPVLVVVVVVVVVVVPPPPSAVAPWPPLPVLELFVSSSPQPHAESTSATANVPNKPAPRRIISTSTKKAPPWRQ
jgi:hypothetical protein